MGLKHIIKEIIRIRKHIYNLQSFNIVEKLRPLHQSHRSNHTQLLHKNSLYFFRCITTENNNNSIIYSNDTEELENDDFDADRPNIRNILYKNSTDPLVQELNECASVQDVFNIIRGNSERMDHVHISQSVLVLWDLQKIFYKHNIYYENGYENLGAGSELHANAILKKYISQVNSHKDFDTLVRLIIKNYEKFSLDALTCTLLYLQRMGVAIKTNVMQLMISRCEREIKNCDKLKFPLTALSRFIVTIYHQEILYPVLVSIDALAIVLQRLENCSTEEDFKLLTICLFRMKQLLTLENVETYKKVALKLVDEKKITNQNSRTILKALKFLACLQWHEYNIQCTSKLMQLLKNSISQLNSHQLLTVYKVFQLQKEPADMLEELQEHALYQISNLEEEEEEETMLDLISCVVSFCSPLEKPKFEKLTRRYIEKKLSSASLGALYKILYHMKPSDVQLCNTFWDKCYELAIQNENREDLLKNTLMLCSKYIHFSQDVGHKYCYEKFEQALLDVLVKEIHTSDADTFIRIASFIIAYGKDSTLDEKILDQLVEMAPMFNVYDVLNISKGMQIALQSKYNSAGTNNQSIWNRFQTLNNALNQSISQEIQPGTKLPIVNICLRSYVTRKCSVDDVLFEKMLKHFMAQTQTQGQSEPLFNSHIVKDLSFYLQMNSYLWPDIIDKMTEYIVESDERLLGNTVEKVLQLCYFLGYSPKIAEHFLDVVSKIIIRDQERFTGLTFLQTSLALCYFHKLPELLIKQIFSVGFLEKLDEELSNCYAKATYPIRVRDHMMQLNRAVCLDYPQSNVPWFHEKYIETEKYKKQIFSKVDYFQKQVDATIHDVLKDTKQNLNLNVNMNTFSPYGYHLDFVLTNKEDETFKTAILLLKTNYFTNYTKNLKGYFQLKQRHLEILGYNVVNISYDEWKSFYIQQHCIEFMRNKLSPHLQRNIGPAILSESPTS